MPRITLALGALLSIQCAVAVGQQAGAWNPSRPGSKAIIYDEQGRRLYWDSNGQIVGRYSFATGKYLAELPGKQREESIEAPARSPGESQRKLAIVYWGRGRAEEMNRLGPKIISGPIDNPRIVRHGIISSPPEGIAGASTTSIAPNAMP